MKAYTSPSITTEPLRKIAAIDLWQMDSDDCVGEIIDQFVEGCLKRRQIRVEIEAEQNEGEMV